MLSSTRASRSDALAGYSPVARNPREPEVQTLCACSPYLLSVLLIMTASSCVLDFRMDAELTCVAGVAGRGCHASMMALVL
jgi:hypothetical protein